MWELVQKDKLSPAEKSRIDKCIEIVSVEEKRMKRTGRRVPYSGRSKKTLSRDCRLIERNNISEGNQERGLLRK